jgi:hypothetical protein
MSESMENIHSEEIYFLALGFGALLVRGNVPCIPLGNSLANDYLYKSESKPFFISALISSSLEGSPSAWVFAEGMGV